VELFDFGKNVLDPVQFLVGITRADIPSVKTVLSALILTPACCSAPAAY